MKVELYNDPAWRDVRGFEGLYQVSNRGEVRSVTHSTRNNVKGGTRQTVGRRLAQYKMPNGYMQVQLSKNEMRFKKYVHRLVALAFLGDPCAPLEVNHIDGDKQNNNAKNLEWVSHKENVEHAVEKRLTRKAAPVICVETGIEYRSLTAAEAATRVERHKIKEAAASGKVINGEHWRFVDYEKKNRAL